MELTKGYIVQNDNGKVMLELKNLYNLVVEKDSMTKEYNDLCLESVDNKNLHLSDTMGVFYRIELEHVKSITEPVYNFTKEVEELIEKLSINPVKCNMYGEIITENEEKYKLKHNYFDKYLYYNEKDNYIKLSDYFKEVSGCQYTFTFDELRHLEKTLGLVIDDFEMIGVE